MIEAFLNEGQKALCKEVRDFVRSVPRELLIKMDADDGIRTRPMVAGLASNVSTLNTRQPSLDSRSWPISSKMPCMRLPRTDIVMPSGVCVQRMERQVDSPTQTDFQPPLKPR